MTVQTIAGLNRLMLELALGKWVVMAGQAKLVALLEQQIFVGRLVRIVAAQALAIFHRLMLHLVVRQEILVARVAKLTGLELWVPADMVSPPWHSPHFLSAKGRCMMFSGGFGNCGRGAGATATVLFVPVATGATA